MLREKLGLSILICVVEAYASAPRSHAFVFANRRSGATLDGRPVKPSLAVAASQHPRTTDHILQLPAVSLTPTAHHKMRLLTSLFLLALTLTTYAIKAPTSYCKCICFQNSTIIPLNSPPDTFSTSSKHLHLRDEDTTTTDTGGKKHHTLTCNDCNRAFCLEYNLPICKNAKEEDVFATCFRMSCLSYTYFHCLSYKY